MAELVKALALGASLYEAWVRVPLHAKVYENINE